MSDGGFTGIEEAAMTSSPPDPIEPEAQARRYRFELGAAAMIPLLVVGIPWVATSGLLAGRPGPSRVTSSTTTTTGNPATAPAPSGAATTPAYGDSDFLAILRSVTASPTTSTTGPPSTTVTGAPSTSTTGAPSSTTTGAPATTTTGAPTTTTQAPPTTTTRPSPPVPAAPANVAFAFESPDAYITWDAVTTNTDGSPVTPTGYQVTFRAGGALPRIYDTTVPSFVYTFQQNEADFGRAQPELLVTVQAMDQNGTLGAPQTGVAVNPAPPTLTAPPLLTSGPGVITVSVAFQATPPDMGAYSIYEKDTRSGLVSWLADITVAGSYDHTVTPGTTKTYFYRLRDVFGQESAGESELASATAS